MSTLQPHTAAMTAQEELRLEIVKLHAHLLRHMPWMHCVLFGVVVVLIDAQLPWRRFLLWAALVISIEFGRAWYGFHVLGQARRQPLMARTVQWIQNLLAAISGFSVGLLAALVQPQLNLAAQSLLGFVLVTIPALGLAVSMSSPWMAGIYATAVLLPMATTWALLNAGRESGVLLGSLLHVGVLVIAAVGSKRLLLRSVMVRRERDGLVHQLQQSNERAEREVRARSRVLAAASHDLRQPLHALSLYSAVLAGNPPPEIFKQLGLKIDELARSLGELLHGLLDLSQLSSGQYIVARKIFPMDELMASVCAEFHGAAAAKGLHMSQTLKRSMAFGDVMATSRMARNLIDNAIKYTDHGSVTVGLEHDGAELVLSVTDTGRGIAQAEQMRVFEEFYQLDNPGRDRSQGVGLGLTIVHRLAELVGARMTLRSEVGQGSCFELRLPAATAGPASRAQTPATDLAPTHAADPHRRRIYVVDNEPAILHSMKTLLTLWKFDVHTALNGLETSHLFERLGPPHLLVIDLRLADGEDGKVLTRRLLEAHGDFPVLVVTGETSTEVLDALRRIGWQVSTKPLDVQAFQRALARAVDVPEDLASWPETLHGRATRAPPARP